MYDQWKNIGRKIASFLQENLRIFSIVRFIDKNMALPDGVLALLFFVAWYFPGSLGEDVNRYLIRIGWLEFPVLASATFISFSVVLSEERREILNYFIGISVFFSFFALAFGLINHDWSYMVVFIGLSVKRYLWLKHVPVKTDNGKVGFAFLNGFMLFFWVFTQVGVAVVSPPVTHAAFDDPNFMIRWGAVHYSLLVVIAHIRPYISRWWHRMELRIPNRKWRHISPRHHRRENN
jgi:hypothetical protein